MLSKVYKEAIDAAKEYAKTKGPGTQAKPEQHQFFRRLATIIQRTLEKNVHSCDKIDPTGYVIIILLRQKQNHKNLNRHHEWVPLF